MTASESSLRILITDDHMLMRKLISEQLRSLGYQYVETAINGQEALDKLSKADDEKTPFDIVLLDRGMPVMNGMEMLKICRSDPRYNMVAFVMLTGEREQDSVMEALNAGATSYIVKPVSQDMMEQKLKRVTDWLVQHRGKSEAQYV